MSITSGSAQIEGSPFNITVEGDIKAAFGVRCSSSRAGYRGYFECKASAATDSDDDDDDGDDDGGDDDDSDDGSGGGTLTVDARIVGRILH